LTPSSFQKSVLEHKVFYAFYNQISVSNQTFHTSQSKGTKETNFPEKSYRTGKYYFQVNPQKASLLLFSNQNRTGKLFEKPLGSKTSWYGKIYSSKYFELFKKIPLCLVYCKGYNFSAICYNLSIRAWSYQQKYSEKLSEFLSDF
jgi:hypothetical protein